MPIATADRSALQGAGHRFTIRGPAAGIILNLYCTVSMV